MNEYICKLNLEFFVKKCKNFCPLFKKILSLKVFMHMCMKVKDRVKGMIKVKTVFYLYFCTSFI